MNFDEWMTLSGKIIGKEGMAVFEQFVLGEISFEDCLKQMYKVMPQENIEAFEYLWRTLTHKNKLL